METGALVGMLLGLSFGAVLTFALGQIKAMRK